MRDAPGTVLAGKYQLVEQAGEGGMATVWRALTRGAAGFLRPVAIKRIRGTLARDPEFIQMFVEEARVGADIHHPNVVQIHDFGEDDRGQHYLVMEWIEGVDLKRWSDSFVKAGWHAPWHLVAAVGIEALRGLGAAHERTDAWGTNAATFHRDITPGNVLIGLNGIVKLADFGLSRAMDRARVTQPAMVKGKFGYLAPELIEDADPSAATDLFGVGVVLWETLAGCRLFSGPTDVDTIRSIARCEVPPLQRLRPDLPAALTKVVHKALERQPKARFASAREMARAIAAVCRTVAEPTDAEPLGASVALARQRLGMPPRDLPPKEIARR
jgi:serine/threonine protein kinase